MNVSIAGARQSENPMSESIKSRPDSASKVFLDLIIVRTPRWVKVFATASMDVLSICASLFLCGLFLSEAMRTDPSALAYSLASFLSVAWLSGVYVASLRYIGLRVALGLASAAILAAVVWGLSMVRIGGLEFNYVFLVSICLGSLLVFSTVGYRVAIREAVFYLQRGDAENLAIYGASDSARHFLISAMQLPCYQVFGLFTFDDIGVGRTFHGKAVRPWLETEKMLLSGEIDLIVLAFDSETAHERRVIIDRLLEFSARILSAPPLVDLIDRTKSATDLGRVDVRDVLGRDTIPPAPDLIANSVEGRTVMITGAGGTIGSEIVRQATKNGAQKVVLVDQSEPSLFAIQQEMEACCNVEVVVGLGSVTDEEFIERIISDTLPNAIYHAAALKHVPMIEEFSIAGYRTNVHGTRTVIKAAIEYGVERFTFISTDKAVRPTNIMGATKRVAECVCQTFAENGNTKVSVVRFGNVLGSSGSVIPTFERQVKRGGPLTVTHPEMVRYFMTAEEAAGLVLQASAMSVLGKAEVFLLEMGAPVNIDTVARRVIRLSGFNVAEEEEAAPPGSLAIRYTGLRPGEKLFEELLVNGRAEPTLHPRIFKASDGLSDLAVIHAMFEQLDDVSSKGNELRFQEVIKSFPAIEFQESPTRFL